MTQTMYSIEEIENKIEAGCNLFLAGTEQLLSQLPAGQWIGGTIPYFMTESGGQFNQDKIYATILPNYIKATQIKVYDETNLDQVYLDTPDNGFSFIIIPAACKTLLTFALKAHSFKQFAMHPLIGWISGVDMKDLGHVAPKVFDGRQSALIENGAVVMHATLPENKAADIGIINIFEQGDGDIIQFLEDGFSATNVIINGNTVPLADYMAENNLHSKLPLVADYYGALINTSFQEVNHESKQVLFFAPVFKGMKYKHAKPVANYIQKFSSEMPNDLSTCTLCSCNCILNYLYSELEGCETGGLTGPITFGEVAYQLLNQTLVYLTIHDVS